ncbi:MAG: CpXC domain-containing protein, partial [Thermodesulfobacteriota bacterium]
RGAMALKTTYDIRCGCGAAFTKEIFEYVLAEHDPELRDAILSGEFNRIVCPSCGRGLSVGTRYFYRDEKNRLSVWVCPREDEQKRKELARELIEKNACLECHHTDGTDPGRKLLVFGREALVCLLLKADPDLRRTEGRCLRRNPAVRLIVEGRDAPGYLVLCGKKVRVAIHLRYPPEQAGLPDGTEERGRWLRHYSFGMNIHNPYSSFLDPRRKSEWERIRKEEPAGEPKNEYEDFAESWAFCRLDAKRFGARCPERRRFLDGLKGVNIPRKVRPLRVGRPG